MDDERIYEALADARLNRISLLNEMIRQTSATLYAARSWLAAPDYESQQKGLKAVREVEGVLNSYLHEVDRA